MKILLIVPGTVRGFYCENCARDLELAKALRGTGADAFVAPLYLPLAAGSELEDAASPVFYGAVNVYLEQYLPVYGLVPRPLRKLLDSEPVLGQAAKMGSSTKAKGLEDLTISVLHGAAGRHASEFARLLAWVKEHERPDVIHVSNALLLGIGAGLRKAAGIPVICSLQDEDQWIDAMDEDAKAKVYALIREKAEHVDMLVSASGFYVAKFSAASGIATDRIRTVHPGINPSRYSKSSLPLHPPAVGYLSRCCAQLGLDILAEAFIHLKKDARFADATLHVCGGGTSDDPAFLEKVKALLAEAGISKDVLFQGNFDPASRAEFLSRLTILSVPAREGEAFGLHVLEAFASGVPAILPRAGAFPEILAEGGGVCYAPNTPEQLCATLRELLSDEPRLRALRGEALNSANGHFSSRRMAEEMISVYLQLTGKR